MLAEEDKAWIETRIRELTEPFFMAKNDCDKIVDHQNKKFANDDKRLAVIETYQKITLAVLSAIGVGVLGLVLKQFWG